MVLDGSDFVVRDAKTGDDLTRSILLQIILEEETGGVPMFIDADAGADHPLLRPCDAGLDGLVPREEPADLHRHPGQLAEQSKGLYDPKALTPEMWAQFMNGQAPMMQGLMGNYVEQSQDTCSCRCRSRCTKQAERRCSRGAARACTGAKR